MSKKETLDDLYKDKNEAQEKIDSLNNVVKEIDKKLYATPKSIKTTMSTK